MSTLTDLRDRFKVEAQIASAEQIADSTVEQWLSEAIMEHNAAYAVDATDLPAREVSLVFILAKITLAQQRAESFVNDSDLQGTQGYGIDRSSPFSKNLKLIESLRKEYDRKVTALGLTDDSGMPNVVQGTLTKVDPDFNVRTPYLKDPTKLPSCTLACDSQGDSYAILSWTPSTDTVFDSYAIYFMENSSETIYQKWNFASTTKCPKLNDNAVFLAALSNPSTFSVKVQGLNPTTYSFLVVTRNRNRKYVYSNEISVAISISTNGSVPFIANDGGVLTSNDDDPFYAN